MASMLDMIKNSMSMVSFSIVVIPRGLQNGNDMVPSYWRRSVVIVSRRLYDIYLRA